MFAMELPKLTDSKEVLAEYISSKELLKTLILQIRKDFETAGIPIKLSLSKKYNFAQLADAVAENLSARSSHQLSNLLYRVDVSEKQLHEAMPTPGIDLQLFSEVIIKRELQKVVLRKLYS
jgi:hypothetical protein